MINKYLGFKIGQSITIIGVLISMAAIFVYDRETMVISLVGTLIYGQVLDQFCDGFHVRKKVSILSKEHEKIQNYIVKEFKSALKIYEKIWADEPQMIETKYQEIQELYPQIGFFLGQQISNFLTKQT